MATEVRIIVKPPSQELPLGYIGASATYDAHPGETWRRGNDLADGPISDETLARILDDIKAVAAGFMNSFARDNPAEEPE